MEDSREAVVLCLLFIHSTNSIEWALLISFQHFRHQKGMYREAGFLKDHGKQSQVTLSSLSGINCSHVLPFPRRFASAPWQFLLMNSLSLFWPASSANAVRKDSSLWELLASLWWTNSKPQTFLKETGKGKIPVWGWEWQPGRDWQLRTGSACWQICPVLTKEVQRT